ncbi:Choloylglycine hydrolase [BD1-7 clade bacterium]|uniref:Choloylglycine hydrolase n=1 Tax=BD1-7 clade bacterium TaxID=2029982 RepID=A0A5S9QT74_9GAMM|nr:Choloylglycine hydrolase [BD1-7 clade bacterium]
MNIYNPRTILHTILGFTLIFANLASACTGIQINANDGTVIHARTLEFAVDIESDVIIVPRGFERTGSTPDKQTGARWASKYASVGANALGLPNIIDGVNEQGLSIGLFYFPGFADYMPYNKAEAGKTIAPLELGSWMLDNFKDVKDVREHIGNIVVANVVFPQWGFVPPVHYIVQDAKGNAIVVEYTNGKLNVHDNPLGVITNSPTFDWHMTNLRNYVNLSFSNVEDVKLGNQKLAPFGQGSGMLGIPGDFTPPSRFVRAAAFSQGLIPVETGKEGILQAFHLLNNFDIPKGAARDSKKDKHGNIVADYTLWTSAVDLKERAFYFRTYEDSQIKRVDLLSHNLDSKTIKTISMKGQEVIKTLN